MVGLVLAIASCRAPLPAQSRLIGVLEQRIPGWLSRYEVPGIGIALIHEGQLNWSRGFGLADAAGGRSMTNATICRTGAISESLTAWGVMKLVERGQVELDAPIGRYLQRWELPPSRFDHSEVTVRRLLSHCSGIRQQYYPHRKEAGERPETRALLSGIALDETPVHVSYPPGSDFLFSQANYTLLELLIEEVSGEDFAAFMEREVLRPLGMQSSNYDWDAAPPRKRAAPHDRRQKPLPVTFVDHRAAAGLNSTAYDLAAFLAAALPSLHNAVYGYPVLNERSINLMERPAPLPENAEDLPPGDRRFGLGYLIERTPEGRLVFTQGGNIEPGWHARFYGVPETAAGLVILANGRNGEALANTVAVTWAETAGIEELPSIAAIRKNRRLARLLLVIGGLAALAFTAHFLYFLRTGQRALARDRWKRRLPFFLLLGGLVAFSWTAGRQWLLAWSPELYPWGPAVASLLGAATALISLFPRTSGEDD